MQIDVKNLIPNMNITSQQILPLLVGFLQVVVAAILLLSFRSNKHVNIFLIIIIVLGAGTSLYRGLVGNEFDVFTNDEFSWVRFFMVMTIPATYLYIRMLVNEDKRVNVSVLFHLLYPILWFTLLIMQSVYHFIPADIWYNARKVNVIAYLFLYVGLNIRTIKDFYQKRNQDHYTATYFDSMKNWIFTFFIFILLINLRALIHFCFDLENKGGIFWVISQVLNVVFIFFINLKILTTPEILYGYPKLKHSLSSDIDQIEVPDSVISVINNQYYLINKPIHDYFEGKTLECLLVILESGIEFININSLDDIFVSEYKASLPTVKKRREQSLKEIKFLLSFRLEVPADDIFIESRDEIDKRIKLIKINPKLLKLT